VYAPTCYTTTAFIDQFQQTTKYDYKSPSKIAIRGRP